jgi:hypothetical protein
VAEETGFWELVGEAGKYEQVGQDAGKHASRGLQGEVAPDETTSGEASMWIFIHVVDGEGECVRAEKRIGVKQDDVSALSFGEREVVGRSRG